MNVVKVVTGVRGLDLIKWTGRFDQRNDKSV